MIAQDGQIYETADQVPDIGSWTCYEVKPGNVRSYVGLSADIAKLPVYTSTKFGEILGAGSTAMCADTSEAYIYNASDHTWYSL